MRVELSNNWNHIQVEGGSNQYSQQTVLEKDYFDFVALMVCEYVPCTMTIFVNGQDAATISPCITSVKVDVTALLSEGENHILLESNEPIDNDSFF